MGVLYQKRLSYRNGQNKQPDNNKPSSSSDIQVLNFTAATESGQGWNYKRTGRLVPIHVGYYAKSDDYYCTFKKCHPSRRETCSYCKEYLEEQAVQMDESIYHLECLDECIVSKILEEMEAAASADDSIGEIPSRDVLLKSLSICNGCQKEIKGYHGVFALGQKWHASCFKCHDCKKVLLKDYAVRNREPYCSDDYKRLFGVFCAGCRNYVDGEFLEIGEYNFHSKCAICEECKKPFPDDAEAIVINDKVWHKLCHGVEDVDGKHQTAARAANVSPKLQRIRGISVSKLQYSNLDHQRCSSTERLQDIGKRGRSISESDTFDSWGNPNRCRSVTLNGHVMLGDRDDSCSPSSPTAPRNRPYDTSKRMPVTISSTSTVSAIATPPARRRQHVSVTSISHGKVSSTIKPPFPPSRSSPAITHTTIQASTKCPSPPRQSSPLNQRKSSETVSSTIIHVQNPVKSRRGVSVPIISRPNITTASNHSSKK